jgi:hypothetical protein
MYVCVYVSCTCVHVRLCAHANVRVCACGASAAPSSPSSGGARRGAVYGWMYGLMAVDRCTRCGDVCMYMACTHACTYASCMHMYVCMYACIGTYACMYVCAYQAYVRVHACTYVRIKHMYVCMHVRMYVCMHVYVCVHIRMYVYKLRGYVHACAPSTAPSSPSFRRGDIDACVRRKSESCT